MVVMSTTRDPDIRLERVEADGAEVIEFLELLLTRLTKGADPTPLLVYAQLEVLEVLDLEVDVVVDGEETEFGIRSKERKDEEDVEEDPKTIGQKAKVKGL
jgi:hypothetical protein